MPDSRSPAFCFSGFFRLFSLASPFYNLSGYFCRRIVYYFSNILMLYRNQYLIVPKGTNIESAQLDSVDFDNLAIYAHPNLHVSKAVSGKTEIALLGFIINPLFPDDSNEDIVVKLVKSCVTVEDFFKHIQVLSGRYVLLFKTYKDFIVAGDPSHLRQIYYRFENDSIFLTSSLKLYLKATNQKLKISEEKKAILESDLFKRNESAWYGDESIDERLRKLMPNHYLDVKKREVKRIPVFPSRFANEDQIMDYAAMILRNTFTSLTKRYHLIQPLTAGLDSRILLAASKDVREKIKYYVFDPLTKNAPDVWVPVKLSKELGIKFEVIEPQNLRPDFLDKFRENQYFPRILPKTAHIQSHFDADYGPDVVNVNGNCSEITRFVYGSANKQASFEMLLTFSRYGDKIPYFTDQLRKWYAEAVPFAEEYGIPVLDLFYWEHRIGNWHALWQFEQDVGVEEVSPFNNRSLINALLLVNPQKRKSPDYSFFTSLARHLWADVLTAPINPGKSRIKTLIKGSSSLKYIAMRAKKFFRILK